MARDTELVAFGVAEVRAIVVGMVLRPQTGSTLRDPPIGKSYCMSLVDHRSAAGKKGDHLPVADFLGLRVVGLADEEQRPWVWMRLPACPGTLPLAEALLHAKHWHQRAVERKRAIEILDADEDVREQGRSAGSPAAVYLEDEVNFDRRTLRQLKHTNRSASVNSDRSKNHREQVRRAVCNLALLRERGR